MDNNLSTIDATLNDDSWYEVDEYFEPIAELEKQFAQSLSPIHPATHIQSPQHSPFHTPFPIPQSSPLPSNSNLLSNTQHQNNFHTIQAAPNNINELSLNFIQMTPSEMYKDREVDIEVGLYINNRPVDIPGLTLQAILLYEDETPVEAVRRLDEDVDGSKRSFLESPIKGAQAVIKDGQAMFKLKIMTLSGRGKSQKLFKIKIFVKEFQNVFVISEPIVVRAKKPSQTQAQKGRTSFSSITSAPALNASDTPSPVASKTKLEEDVEILKHTLETQAKLTSQLQKQVESLESENKNLREALELSNKEQKTNLKKKS